MIESNPLESHAMFFIGMVPVTGTVVTTIAIVAMLTAVSWIGLRNPKEPAGYLQSSLEILVETIALQLEEIIQRDPWPYMPLIGSLFLFLVVANLVVVVPEVSPPTAHLATPGALALVVLFSVHFYGIRAQGLQRYLRRYTKPNLLMLPLNVLSELTRTFSLMVRLFGNIMSHEFMIAILIYLVGLLVPIPFMLLGILIGIIQAYIFTVLAAVLIAAGIGNSEMEGD